MDERGTINDTISGFPRLSGYYNEGYRKAIQDIIEVFQYMNHEMNGRHMRMNYVWAMKILNCCLENREKLRDDWNGFMRIEKSDSGKWDIVRWAKSIR